MRRLSPRKAFWQIEIAYEQKKDARGPMYSTNTPP